MFGLNRGVIMVNFSTNPTTIGWAITTPWGDLWSVFGDFHWLPRKNGRLVGNRKHLRCTRAICGVTVSIKHTPVGERLCAHCGCPPADEIHNTMQRQVA